MSTRHYRLGHAHSHSRHRSPSPPSYHASSSSNSSGEDRADLDGPFEMAEMTKNPPRRESDVQEQALLAAREEGLDEESEYEDDDGLSDQDSFTGRPTRHRSRSSEQSVDLYSPQEEMRVRRKLDIYLVLFVSLLYMMAFLDRSNIGNAKTAGLEKGLGLKDGQFEWFLTAFYIAYIAFEWMTLCYKIFPAHIYISTCVFAWGIIASLQSLVSDFASMLVLRTLLGISEAAFVGMPIYLSFFFKRRELAFRTGVFVAAAPLATSFASTLAYLIVNFGDRVPIDNWRLLFLVEGFPACLVAIFAWSWLPDSPGQARWLTLNERKIADRRMRRDTGQEKLSRLGASSRHTRKLDWTAVWAPLKDPKSYMTAGMFFCCNVAFSSMPVFLPTIVNNMGNSPLASQGLSAPPMLFAFVVVLVTAFLSDRIGSRSGPLLFHTLMAMAGYVVLALAGPLQLGTVVRYMAVFPVCAGFFSAVTIVITWTVNNQESDEGKGTGMAVLNVFGQMGPVLGTRLYPDRDAPYYGSGMVVCASAMAMAAALALVLRVYLQRENKRRMRYQRVDGEEESTGGHKKGKKPFELMI